MKNLRRKAARNYWLAAFLGGSAATLFPNAVPANPFSPTVTAGSAGFSNPNANTLLIQQGAGDAVINWQDFSIGAGESVIFEQASASAAVLNRVTGGLPSEILGKLTANGRVFIVNPLGIVFSKTAQVDVGALIASTLDISDDDFLAGRYLFTQAGSEAAAISNAGVIRAAEGGFVVLAADQISNSGLIATRLGSVVLGSGSAMTLSLDDQGMVSFTLDAASSSGLAQALNSGQIENDGGVVLMTAATAQSLASAAVNNTGLIRAQSLVEHSGEIHLLAAGGDAVSSGMLDASSGGAVNLQGQHVKLDGNSTIGTGGTLSLTADAISIASCNDPAACSASLQQAELASQLRDGVNVGLASNGSITFQGLANGLLDGRATNGSGGSMGLFATQDIVFEQASDQLLVDGAIQAIAGGSILLGDLSSHRAIILEAQSGNISVGSLALDNPADSALLGLFGSDGVTVRGAIDVHGQLAQVGDGTDQFDLVGARVRVSSVNGDILLQGPVSIIGSVASASVGSSSQVTGAELLLNAEFASVRVAGPVQLDGTLGTVTGGDALSARGALLQLNSGSGTSQLGGAVELTGHIGSVSAFGMASLQGVGLVADSYLGDVLLDGGAQLTGSVTQATLGDFAIVAGADVDVNAQFGAVVSGGALQLDGRIASVEAGQGSEIRAAAVQLKAETFFDSFGDGGTTLLDTPVSGDIAIHGGITVVGNIDSATTTNDSGVLGAVLFSQATHRNSVLGGALSLDGTLGTLNAGDDAFVLASFATLLSDQDGIVLDTTATVTGHTSTSVLGERGQLTGAVLWLDTSGPRLDLDGGLSVSSTLGSTSGGFGLTVNGAYAYLNAYFGSTTVAGDVLLDTSIASITGTGGAVVTGSQLLSGVGFDSNFFNDVLVEGNIRQHASIGTVSFIDATTSSVYNGSVLLDAGVGSVAFHDITADNLFVYFDSNSTLAQSRLDITDYAEVFSVSVTPVLSGGTLDIHAGELFLSANTDFDSLSASTTRDLSVFLSDVSADNLQLQSGGALQFTGSRLVASSMQLGGNVIFSDADSRIDAGALDVVATQTILLTGETVVGSGQSHNPGDTALLRQLGVVNGSLLPRAAAPNAFFSAPTVGIANLSLAGDYLRIRSDFVFLGALDFLQPQTFVHLDPLRNLPLFSESVSASVLGDQASKVPLNRGNIQPNIGAFSSVLGALPNANAGSERTFAQLNFDVGDQLPSLQQLILQSGLRDSTLVIGGSGFTGSIQISDQLAVDVRPSSTNFVLSTQAGILGADRISTNGSVVVLSGQQFSDAGAFYRQVVSMLETYSIGGPDEFNQSEDEARVEREGTNPEGEQECSQ